MRRLVPDRRSPSDQQGSGVAGASGLGAAETLAVRAVGFEAVGQVMGASVRRVGRWVTPSSGPGSLGNLDWYGSYGYTYHYQAYQCPHYPIRHRWGVNWEHSPAEAAVHDAFRASVDRLVDETQALGGHGAVGVQSTLRWRDKKRSTIEAVVVGTAIARAASDPLPVPFASHLSGQEFAKLITHGWVPTGLVAGCGIVHAVDGCGSSRSFTTRATWDVPQYADAIDKARELAVANVSHTAGDADGVVGVSADVSLTPVSGERIQVAEVLLTGTAVRRFDPGSQAPEPLVMMRL